jgi:hypothetical protein
MSMITQIIDDMSMSQYRSEAGLSKHQFDNFLQSPAYYKYKLEQEWKPSREMVLGTLLHSWVLEGNTDWAVGPQVDRRTKAGKEEWQVFCEMNINKEVVTVDEAARLEAAGSKAMKMLKHLSNLTIEASMFWERGGVQCKGRPDLIWHDYKDDKVCIVDLKTTSDFFRFPSKFWQFGYDLQAAWYAYGYERITGIEADFRFLVVDMEAPHFCQWMEMDEAAWTYANQRIDSQLQSFKLLQELDEWPEPSEEVRLLSRVRRD